MTTDLLPRNWKKWSIIWEWNNGTQMPLPSVLDIFMIMKGRSLILPLVLVLGFYNMALTLDTLLVKQGTHEQIQCFSL